MDEATVRYSAHVRGEGVKFERIRRITGYLVGSMDRWNAGKRAEEHDRVKHSADNSVYSTQREEMLVR